MENLTYHRLLDTAQDLVQKYGFNAFSYQHLSEAVGIKTASIHYHFPGKENLGVALARRHRERFNAVLEQIEAENADAQTRIEQYAEQFLQTLRQGGKICLCGMLASDYATLPEKVRVQIRAFFTENEAWLTKVLKQGKKNGEFKFKGDAEDLAVAFFSMLEGAMLGARMFGDESRLQQVINCWRTALLIKNVK
ncbi:MAG: TetR/AcrR family transcriptional regulator [Acidobacteriota bacterium]|nr:TetR/AcrR family transcriptional regulator [Acidobacteriota bacterium]